MGYAYIHLFLDVFVTFSAEANGEIRSRLNVRWVPWLKVVGPIRILGNSQYPWGLGLQWIAVAVLRGSHAIAVGYGAAGKSTQATTRLCGQNFS